MEAGLCICQSISVIHFNVMKTSHIGSSSYLSINDPLNPLPTPGEAYICLSCAPSSPRLKRSLC